MTQTISGLSVSLHSAREEVAGAAAVAPVAPASAPPQTLPEEIAVVVTHDHIRHGAMRSLVRCPLALALQASGYGRVSVTGCCVWLGNPGSCEFDDLAWTKYEPPPELAEWIERFDKGLPVAPERFVLRRAAKRCR